MAPLITDDGTRLVALVVVALGIGLVLAGSAAADEAAELESLDGDGTEDDPYVITTVEELQAMNQDLEAHYVLGNDIDASETDRWNAGAGFEPIGDGEYGDRTRTPFSGTFDGQGHTITDLAIDRPGESHVAPFGENDGTIKNVRFENVDVFSSDRNVAGAVADNHGTIKSVSVTGSVEGQDRWTAGLVARGDEGATIERSMADVEVTGDEYVGGLVGDNSEQSIVHSYATVTVEGNDRVGGLIGWNNADDGVRNSYVTGTVSGESEVGGLVGWFAGPVSDGYVAVDVTGDDTTGALVGAEYHSRYVSDGTVSNVYYDTRRSALDSTGEDSDFGTGLRTTELTGADAERNVDFDFDNFWTATDEYPVLEWQVEAVDLSVSQSAIGEGETTPVTVELTLDDGSTVTASEVADYDSEAAVASVSEGVLEANSVGETEITATVAGESDTVTVEVLEPPNIAFVDAEFDVEAAVEGTTVGLDATYENTGGPGSERVSVAVGDEDVTSTQLQLGADEKTTESIEWTAAESGTVTVDDEPYGELTVVDAENVSLEAIELPDEAAEGSEYEIGLEFATDLDTPVLETVELRVDGDRVATEVVEIDADGSADPISYAHDEQGTATHVVERHNETETGIVEILEPAEFEIEDLDAPESVEEGEQETVSATVTNVGGGEDDAELELRIDGEVQDTQTVTLDSGDSEPIQFDVTFDTDGDVTVGIASPDDEREVSVAVEAAGDSAAMATGDDAGADDDSIPGLTAVAAVLAVALALAAVARRR
ncbi:CARDB domain-containing protein [Natronobeatus ordinarius]|uniref:CARDB domain-containing protein n=1 Tax=Natronobeatus ordinarius TaxID=2963433 RepID=UPI0020CC6305|nr:CARDB domain-containing protein [Natronobeatus ordinarius]